MINKFNNVFELKEFYESPLGKFTCRKIRHIIIKLWPEISRENILGYGFTLPYLPLMAYNNKCASFMPLQIGAMQIGDSMPSAMIDPESFPARNDYFDKIIIIHGLENSPNLQPTLEQLWRVLKPKGKIIIAIPNQATPWQKLKTPYCGLTSYSKFQITEHLNQTKFAIRKYRKALFFIPTKWPILNKFTNNLGAIFFRSYAGIHVIEAEKLVYGVTGGRPTKIVTTFWDKVFKPRPARI